MKNIIEKEIVTKEVTDSDWFNEYDQPREETDQLPIFEMKLQPGKIARTEKIVFLSDGKPMLTRFGATIIFNIKNDGIDKTWFIKKQQYSLLNPIAKELKKGSIVGREAEVQRSGTGKTDTKWSVNFK